VRLENEKNIFNTDCNNNAGERGRMHENNNNYNTPAFDYPGDDLTGHHFAGDNDTASGII
jgi:hypothetical protein